MVDPFGYFSFQSVPHDWCNKGHVMCYPVCGTMHIKEPLLLIEKSSLFGGSGFPLFLSEWSFTKCLTPYSRKKLNVLSVSLNKTFPSFLMSLYLMTHSTNFPKDMIKNHRDNEKENLLPPLHGLLFLIGSKGSFTPPQTG